MLHSLSRHFQINRHIIALTMLADYVQFSLLVFLYTTMHFTRFLFIIICISSLYNRSIALNSSNSERFKIKIHITYLPSSSLQRASHVPSFRASCSLSFSHALLLPSLQASLNTLLSFHTKICKRLNWHLFQD